MATMRFNLLADTPIYELEDFVGAKFYCLQYMPLLTAASAIRLEKRR